MWKYCNLNMLIRFADWIQLTASPTVWTKFQSPWESMCVSPSWRPCRSAASHPPRSAPPSCRGSLFEGSVLQRIQTLSKVSTPSCSMDTSFCLLPHGQVRPCRIPAYLTGQEIRMRVTGKDLDIFKYRVNKCVREHLQENASPFVTRFIIFVTSNFIKWRWSEMKGTQIPPLISDKLR